MCWPYRRRKEEKLLALEEEISERTKQFLEKVHLNDDCALCLSQILAIEAIVCARCRKCMHKQCLKEWESTCSKQEIRFTCPLCRTSLASLK